MIELDPCATARRGVGLALVLKIVSMLFYVLCPCEHLQVTKTVVRCIPVDVMNNHASRYSPIGSFPNSFSALSPFVWIFDLHPEPHVAALISSCGLRSNWKASATFTTGLELAFRRQMNSFEVAVPRNHVAMKHRYRGALSGAINRSSCVSLTSVYPLATRLALVDRTVPAAQSRAQRLGAPLESVRLDREFLMTLRADCRCRHAYQLASRACKSQPIIARRLSQGVLPFGDQP